MTIRKSRITQLELEGFAAQLQDAEEGGVGFVALSAQEIRERSLAAKMVLEKTILDRMLKDKDKEVKETLFPDWSEPYHRLLNAGLPWRIAAYVAWATMPKNHRWPETQDQLAMEVLGLTSDRSISTWRRKHPEIDQLIADMQAEAMLEYRPGAIHALGTVASDASYRANPDRRLLFEMTGDHVPRSKVDVGQASGIGKSILDRLDKLPTDKLIEMLGPDALDIIEELKEEIEETPDPRPPSASPLSPKFESASNLGEEDEGIE
jgi:hypothetical protein